MKTTYYLIRDRIVARRESDGDSISDRIFADGEWVDDTGREIMDHLMGFDPSEPKGSPYRFGNTDVLMEMDEIPEETAKRIIDQQRKD